MRPIDADALKQVVNADINRCYMLRIDGVGPLCKFLDDIDAQPTVEQMPLWISVEDRMPEPGTRVLAAHKNGTVVENYFSSITRDFTFSETYGPPTHWMPLPVPPMKTKLEG